MLDYEERLLDYLESISLPFKVVADANDINDSISLVSMPGGNIVRSYYNGVVDKQLTHFIQVKTDVNSRQKAIETLLKLSGILENLEELESKNGSFELTQIVVTNEPYYFQRGDDGFIYFRMSIQSLLTLF